MAQLERKLGLAAVTAICLGAMLGSGIFVLPGMAAAKAGPSMWLAYLLAGLSALPAALSTAELGTAMPTTGGKYVYLDRTFGPFWGTIAGLGLWLSLLLKAAFALVGFSAYLKVFAHVPLKVTSLILLVGISVLNIMGVRKVGQFQIWIVSTSVVCLLGLIAWSVPLFRVEQMTPLLPYGTGGLLAATGFVFVSYYGVTKAAAIAGEIKDPGRNLPAGILISLGLAALLYSSIGMMLIGTQPLSNLQRDLHPIYTLALSIGGSVVGIGAAVLGVVTMTSMANTGLLAASRFPFAMSRDRLLPSFLARVHQKFLTPVACIILTSLVIGFAILFLRIEQLAKLASSFLIVIFISVNIAQMVLRYSKTPWYKPIFLAPLFPYTQIVGVLFGLLLLTTMGWIGIMAIFGMALPGSLVYLIYGRRYAERSGLVSRLLPRKDRPLSFSQPIYTLGQQTKSSLKSDIVVGLVGWERSPETLVEIAGAIANKRSISVIHMTEIPEQTPIESVQLKTVAIKAIERRVRVLAQAQDLDLEFETLLSHDISHTLNHAVEEHEAETLVLAWRGRRRLDPMNWLYRHIHSNLALFQDAGIRYIREILIYTEPGPHDTLVVRTADQLANLFQANLTFAQIPGAKATPAQKQSQSAYLKQLSEMCTAPCKIVTMKGQSPVDTLIQSTQAYDLLVLGAPPEYAGKSIFAIQTQHDLINEEAYCSVLTLQTPRKQTHEAFTSNPPEEREESKKLLDNLDSILIDLNIPVRNKEALFQHIAPMFAKQFEELDAPQIVAALWDREKEQNTSVGGGIAFPHTHIDTATHTQLGIFTTQKPINYHSTESVDVIFAIIGPSRERRTQLLLLSWLSQVFTQTESLDKLRAAQSPQEVLDLLKE